MTFEFRSQTEINVFVHSFSHIDRYLIHYRQIAFMVLLVSHHVMSDTGFSTVLAHTAVPLGNYASVKANVLHSSIMILKADLHLISSRGQKLGALNRTVIK